eukprot:TRINITY_DN40240_c0_g1_i1.p1 TRINITY_DN40240_c0_g1~~TRINITY_DN40240_c0_g1_i1.p1  ORF type:complete len:1128 (+),score=162.96 TRINITY_DN40240_c0_g1_i1:238-3384(+)
MEPWRKNRPTKLIPIQIGLAAGAPALNLRRTVSNRVEDFHSARGSNRTDVHAQTVGSFGNLNTKPDPVKRRIRSGQTFACGNEQLRIKSSVGAQFVIARNRPMQSFTHCSSTPTLLVLPSKDTALGASHFGHCGTTMRELKMRALEEQREARSARTGRTAGPAGSDGESTNESLHFESDGKGNQDSPRPSESFGAQSSLAESPREEAKSRPFFSGFPSFRDTFDRRCNSVLSPAELTRTRLSFSRFTPAGASYMSEEGLHDALIHLGYLADIELDGMEDAERTLAEEVATNSAVAEDGLVRFDCSKPIVPPARMNKLLELSFSEFIDFLEKYEEREREALRSIFEAHCTDKESQTLPSSKLPTVFDSLGIVTVIGVLEEALELASLNKKDSISFTDMLGALSALRACEGFSAGQLQAAKNVFDEIAEPLPGYSWEESNSSASKGRRVRPSRVKDGLISLFGLDLAQQACDLTQGLESGVQAGVGLHEFVVWARRLDILDLRAIRDRFVEMDDDDDGVLSLAELDKLMMQLGFTLFKAGREELLLDIGAMPGQDFRFDDAVRYLKACRSKDGFTRKELEDLTANFEKFDHDSSGEITNLQVLDLLRHLGYTTNFDNVHELAKKVDLNGNGTMDIGEFTRLMRIFREKEIARAQSSFVRACSKGQEVSTSAMMASAAADGLMLMHKCKLQQAVDFLGYKIENSFLAKNVLADSASGASSCELSDGSENEADAPMMSFEEFMSIVDECRATSQRMKRKHAGYHEGELRTVREVFNRFDTKSAGELERGELLWMLAEFGLPVQTMEFRSTVFGMIEKAREAARDAGAESDEVEDSGSSRMRYWPVVQLLRLICRDTEGDLADREEEARKTAGFSAAETSEFRDVFLQHTRGCVQQDHRLAGRRPRDSVAFLDGLIDESRMESYFTQTGMDKKRLVGLGADSWLPLTGVKQLLASICTKMTRADSVELEKKVREIAGHMDESKRELAGVSEDVMLDFPKFLILMRWVLDTNFADMNGVADSIVKSCQDVRSNILRETTVAEPSNSNASRRKSV